MTLHDPAFKIGVFPVHPFGLFAAIGLVLGYVVALWRTLRVGLAPRFLPGMVIIIVLGAVVLARLGFVAQHPDTARGGAQSVLALWHGGLSLAAGLGGGALLLLLYTWAHRLPVWLWADAIAPAAALGLAVGMLGQPYGGEGWGQPTRGPFFMRVAPSLRPTELVNATRFQPIFAYEAALFGALALVLLALLWRRRRATRPLDGAVGLLFLCLGMLGYGALRPLTLDAATPLYVLETQVFCAAVAALAGAVLIVRLWQRRRQAEITREIELAVNRPPGPPPRPAARVKR